MIDFTTNITAFYTILPSIHLPYPDHEKKALFHINHIAQKLNINTNSAFLTDEKQLLCWLSQHKLTQIPAITNNGCLQEIKKISQTRPNIAINLKLLPLYFDLDLKNITAKAFILPISPQKHLIFSNLPHYHHNPDTFDTLAIVLYDTTLNHTKKLNHIAQLKSTFDQQFAPLNINCQKLNKAYFFSTINVLTASNAQKIKNALFVENILVSTHKNLIQIVFKPWHNDKHLKQLIFHLTKILERLRLISD